MNVMRKQRRTVSRLPKRLAAVGLCLLLPVLMGGCPEFRNESVTAFETASRGVLDAAIDLFFDQFRSDQIG